jgi:hypothetical protein
MKRSFFYVICFSLISIVSFSQDRTIDSLLLTRKTDSLEGKVKTYYSPGNKKIATELQQLVSDAILYYEKKYDLKFNIQMIVLDSAQWFKELLPYGFVFYDGTNWLVLNTGMDYENFKSVYGFNSISHQLDSSFKENKITAQEVIYSRLKFLSLHELGHYFIYNLSNAQSPDFWTNEFIAWYFANEYITKYQPEIKRGFDVFCRTVSNFYPVEHTTLSDFNELYTKVKIGNFAWYHSRFYFLADTLYKCAGDSYLKTFETNFPKKEVLNYSSEMINKLIEANCYGVVSKWITSTESNLTNQ